MSPLATKLACLRHCRKKGKPLIDDYPYLVKEEGEIKSQQIMKLTRSGFKQIELRALLPPCINLIKQHALR